MVFSLLPIIAPISAEVRPFRTRRATSSSFFVSRARERARLTRRARSTSTAVTFSTPRRRAPLLAQRGGQLDPGGLAFAQHDVRHHRLDVAQIGVVQGAFDAGMGEA